jgi:excisionase family DNA binding protein
MATASVTAMSDTHQFLTVAELADLFRVDVRTVRAWSHQGKLPRPVRVGRKLLFSAKALEKRYPIPH